MTHQLGNGRLTELLGDRSGTVAQTKLARQTAWGMYPK